MVGPSIPGALTRSPQGDQVSKEPQTLTRRQHKAPADSGWTAAGGWLEDEGGTHTSRLPFPKNGPVGGRPWLGAVSPAPAKAPTCRSIKQLGKPPPTTFQGCRETEALHELGPPLTSVFSRPPLLRHSCLSAHAPGSRGPIRRPSSAASRSEAAIVSATGSPQPCTSPVHLL